MLGYGKDVLVGGFVPQPVSDQLSLYAFYKDASKSGIIRKIVEDQLEKEAPSNQKMVSEIAKRLFQNWQQYEAPECSFNEFITKAKVMLSKRKVSVKFIGLIIKRLEQMNNGESDKGN